MNYSFSDSSRPFPPNTSFSAYIMTGDPEARGYNLFLSRTLYGSVKPKVAETSSKSVASLLFI